MNDQEQTVAGACRCHVPHSAGCIVGVLAAEALFDLAAAVWQAEQRQRESGR